jgi:hypothetical protein
MLRYSDLYTTPTELTSSIEKSSSDTAVSMFATPADAIVWVKTNTNLVEVTAGVFELAPTGVDMFGVAVPQKLLSIV